MGLILLVSLAKLALAGTVDLNNDEAYYFAYTSRIQCNYFDHPPMVALMIWYTRLAGFLQNTFFLRLPAILLGAGTCWMLFRIGCLLKDERAGWITVVLATCSFYGNTLAGWLVLPDAPLAFFWTWSALVMLQLISETEKTALIGRKLLLLGCLIACAILSKLQGTMLWIGFLAYLVYNRHLLLRNPWLYAALLLTLILVLPSTLWSIDNRFSNLSYHSGRFSFNKIQPGSLITEWLGECGYQNPFTWTGLATLLFRGRVKQMLRAVPESRLMLFLALPLLLMAWGLAIFNSTLPHWNGPAYLFLLPLLALHNPSWLRWATAVFWISLLLLIGSINFYPGTMGRKILPAFGKNDISLDMWGWRELERNWPDSLRKNYSCIITGYWFPAGHLNFYLGKNTAVLAMGSLNQIHHFAWTNPSTYRLKIGDNAIYVSASNYFSLPAPALRAAFDSIGPVKAITQYRMGKAARIIYLFPLIGYKGGLPPNGVLR
jgi:hypothetical protein